MEKNLWITSKGTPVKNKELWIAIDEARNKLKVVDWKWVKAHNGDPKNEEVDTLAYEAAGGGTKKRIYLNVPFEEKDHVKSLGAKWDPVKKSGGYRRWNQNLKNILVNINCNG